MILFPVTTPQTSPNPHNEKLSPPPSHPSRTNDNTTTDHLGKRKHNIHNQNREYITDKNGNPVNKITGKHLKMKIAPTVRIGHINANGLVTPGKVRSAQDLEDSQHLDVLALTETQLTEHNADIQQHTGGKWNLLFITCPQKNNSQNGRGGVGLLTKKNMHAVQIDKTSVNDKTGQIASWTLSSPTWNENIRLTIVYISPKVTEDTLQKIHAYIQNEHRMTGENIIMGDFNSYMGKMRYEPHLNATEQRLWGPIQGDPLPRHSPAQTSSHTCAKTRGRWLKKLTRYL